MSCETSNRRLVDLLYFGSLLALFTLTCLPVEHVSAASLAFERAVLEREIESQSTDLNDGTANAVTLRFGGASRKSFLKLLEVRYVEEKIVDPSFDQQYSLRQLSMSTSTTRGKLAEGLSTFGIGLVGLRLQSSEEIELEYFGVAFSGSLIEPLIGTRLFAKGAIGGEYFFTSSNDQTDSSSEKWSVSNVKAEVGLIYSFPQFDIGASYYYRRLSIDDIQTQVELDTAHGLVALVRVRFGN